MDHDHRTAAGRSFVIKTAPWDWRTTPRSCVKNSSAAAGLVARMTVQPVIAAAGLFDGVDVLASRRSGCKLDLEELHVRI
jgi:hypothetical protein